MLCILFLIKDSFGSWRVLKVCLYILLLLCDQLNSYTKCASTSESNTERIRPYIASLLRDISSYWHSRLWRNSYLHDGVFNLTNNENGSKVSTGFHLWPSTTSLDHNANFIIQIPHVTPGSSALYQAVETLACLNIS